MSQEEKGIVRIETDSGELTLSPSIVRRYLVSGNPAAVTEQEVMMFLGLCKYRRLNPFLREAYLVKYGTTSPATIVVGKDAYLNRAHKHPDFAGFRAGVICQLENGDLLRTDGICPPNAKLIGGWAEVFKKGWEFPHRVEVSLNEYIGRKSDGSVNKTWAEKPCTMIRKVPLVQAIREAFPDTFAGLYSQDEMGNIEDDLPSAHVEIPSEKSMGETIQYEQTSDGQFVPKGPVNGDAQVVQEPPGKPAQRRRTNKFTVSPEQWGGKSEIQTCGSTPEQLLVLRELSKTHRQEVLDALKLTGYSELSYLREDEAKAIIEGLTSPAEPATPPSADPVETAETVECPNNPNERVLKSFCLDGCAERRSAGWCPVIEDPPMSDEGGLL